MTREELATRLQYLAAQADGQELPDGPLGDLLEFLNSNVDAILAALREPDEAAVQRGAKALANIEVPHARWPDDFADNEHEDYRHCAGKILRAAREG